MSLKLKVMTSYLYVNKHREQASHEDGEPGPGVHENLLLERGDSECPSPESGSD